MTTSPTDVSVTVAADLRSGWSCDERHPDKGCRNPRGCHCREITALRTTVESQAKALSEADVRNDVLTVELNGTIERSKLLLDAKNHWMERALAAEARLAQIEAVCVDNDADNCGHQLALRFIRSVAARANQEPSDAR